MHFSPANFSTTVLLERLALWITEPEAALRKSDQSHVGQRAPQRLDTCQFPTAGASRLLHDKISLSLSLLARQLAAKLNATVSLLLLLLNRNSIHFCKIAVALQDRE